jgi:hypothetical protein
VRNLPSTVSTLIVVSLVNAAQLDCMNAHTGNRTMAKMDVQNIAVIVQVTTIGVSCCINVFLRMNAV